MEENIQKILQEKDENVVQFNVTNTTPNPIFIDLFDSANLSPVATSVVYTNPPNSVTGNIGIVAPIIWVALSNSGLIYTNDGATNILIVNPATNSVIGFIPLGIYTCDFLTYNPINNTLYSSDTANNIVLVIDCNTNTILTTIPVTQPIYSDFNSIQNTIYIGTFVNGLVVIDCNTNSIITTIVYTCEYVTYNSTNNVIYTATNTANDITIVDCLTNTIIGTISLPFPKTMFYVASTNFLYVDSNGNLDLSVIDCSTNSVVSSTPIPVVTGAFGGYGCIDPNTGYVYMGTSLGYFLIISSATNTIINYVFVGASLVVTPVFIQSLNSIYVSTPALSTLTILTTIGVTSTPYYITGSANYNAFVNNLNNEPVFIQMVRLLVQNQDQLNNEMQLTTIDSNGNQIFMPNFPINQVSAYQQQGNIGEITLKDVVFDGRTYINQYQLNAYESMSFEIYYKQLDLTSVTPTFPIFFKPKVQLKEYIKKELNL